MAQIPLLSVAAASSTYEPFRTPARWAKQHALAPLLPAPVVAGHSFTLTTTQTDVGMFSRTKHYVLVGSVDVRVVFSNTYIGSGDVTPPNSITVKASLEHSGTGSGTYFPLHFHGEDTNGYVTIRPGGFVISQPVPLDTAVGEVLWVNSNVAPTSGGSYPVGNGTGNTATQSAGEYRIPATTTDYTASFPGSGFASGTFYGPHAIVGTPVGGTAGKRPAQVFVWGDSILAGSGDASFSSWGLVETGFVRQALNNTIPYVFAARSSTQAQHFNTASLRRFTAALLSGATHGIDNFGINDLASSRTLAQLQADKIKLWTVAANRDVAWWTTTITPNTTSTDSWATTANQTVKSFESLRVAYNAWVRDGAPILNGAAAATGSSATGTLRTGAAGHPLSGYIEVADVCETSRDSGLWKVNAVANYATADGLHPSAAFHTLMAAVVPVASFVAT